MDGLLLDHGIADLSLVIEPLSSGDRQTQSMVNGYLAATFSDMTQRSHAIRLVMPGAEPGRTLGAPSLSQAAGSLPAASRYVLRASLAPNAGVTAQGQTLGLELALLNVDDLSVVPGTGRYNEISLRSGPAAFTKFGQPFSVSAATTSAGATRALVEMSAIELVGRLTRLPYWTCFGVDDGNDAVAAEVQDWYDALAARPVELITYFQQALRQRRLYVGPVDGVPNAGFREAVARTRAALGQPRESKLSLEFFKAWLSADAAVLAPAIASRGEASVASRADAPVVTPADGPSGARADVPLVSPIVPPRITQAATPSALPLTLSVSAGGESRRFARGESVNLSVRPNREAHVYCFLHDEQGQIVRFFPNRFQRDSRVPPGAGLRLPGAGQFRLVMNAGGITETVACFATERDVLAELPDEMKQGDLEPLRVGSLDQVKAAFISVSGGVLGHETLELRAGASSRR